MTVVQGDGRQVLAKLAAEAPYDLMFIDADKISYPHYLAWAADNLRVGGAVVADNAFWGGGIFAPDTADGRGVAEFNQLLAEHRASKAQSSKSAMVWQSASRSLRCWPIAD